MNNELLPRHRVSRQNVYIRPHQNPSYDRTQATPATTPVSQEHPGFQTPDDVASQEDQRVDPNAPIIGHHGKPPRRSLKERLKAITKKQWIIIGVVAALVLGCGGFALYTFVLKEDPKPASNIRKSTPSKTAPVSTTVASTLTGLQVDPAINQRPVTAVMIENSLTARPQSGLSDAGIVFEAVAEGGITRFLTLWQDTEADPIGPVRSVRPYYVQWALGFDAGVAHVGGSADGLALVRNEGKDLDQFFNPGQYWRVSTRVAPHNMYSSIPKLRDRQIEKGWTKSNYTGIARKAKETPSATPGAISIDFDISGALYNSHYDYDAASNNYMRSVGGKPHTDERNGQQIAAKVVVGLVLPQGRNGIYTTYDTIGSGEVFIFQDGNVTKGTWTKNSNTAQFVFKDANGDALKLNPGRTWFTVVGSADRVKYNP
jgi:hypothetical protein